MGFVQLCIMLLLLHYYLYNCCNNKLEIISTVFRQQELTGPLVSTLRVGPLPGAYRSDPVWRGWAGKAGVQGKPQTSAQLTLLSAHHCPVSSLKGWGLGGGRGAASSCPSLIHWQVLGGGQERSQGQSQIRIRCDSDCISVPPVPPSRRRTVSELWLA